MDHEIGLQALRPGGGGGLHDQSTGGLQNPIDLRLQPQVDPTLASRLCDLVRQIRIEALERARPSVQDGDRGPGAHGDVREFHGNVAAAHEHDPLRLLVELEKGLAGSQCVLAWNPERGWPRAGGNDHGRALEIVVTDAHRGGSDELRAAMERVDAEIAQPRFLPGRDRRREAALEGHQLGPIDPRAAGLNPSAAQAMPPLERFGLAMATHPAFPKRELFPGREPIWKFLSRVKRRLGFAPRRG